MKILPFRAVYANLDLVTSSDSFFGSMKYDFPTFVQSGFFQQSSKEAIYVYVIQAGVRTHHAIVASNDLSDIKNKKILKHENTLAAKEQSMMQLILQRNAMIKPVLLAYDHREEIDAFIKEEVSKGTPLLDIKFEESGETHRVYEVSNVKKIKKLQDLFDEKVKKCYIADGHHRVSTTMILNEGNHLGKQGIRSMLSVYFAFDELDMYEYNRSILIRDNVSDALLMARLSRVVKIKELSQASKPKQKHEITMLLNGQWYRLRWKKRILKKYSGEGIILDTYLLNKYVLKEVSDIKDIRTSQRVKYIAGTLGTEGIEEVTLGEKRRVGFCLYPMSFPELKYVADQGINLPPKSTWFEPRIKNGVIVENI